MGTRTSPACKRLHATAAASGAPFNWCTTRQEGGSATKASSKVSNTRKIHKGDRSLQEATGPTPAEARAIAEADLHFLDAIGLHQHLSPTRSNGLASMVKQMRLYAAALDASTFIE